METRCFDFLNAMRKKRVLVHLTDGSEVSGVIEAWDPHINLVLSDFKQGDNKPQPQGFIPGPSVMYIVV